MVSRGQSRSRRIASLVLLAILFDVAQDALGFLDCKHTLPVYVQLPFTRTLLHMDALSEFFTQAYLCLELP